MPSRVSSTISGSRLALSSLAPDTFQSEIRAMTTECDRMGGINLAQGVCDTPVPAIVEEAAIQAIRDGQNIYTRCDGVARLREAIAAKQMRDYGLRYAPENEAMVASGATAGLHAAAMALLNPGDEVLLFEPFYGYHVNTLKSLRIIPVLVALSEPDWQLDVDATRAAITPRTRAILLNTPMNPTGKIFTLPELEAVAQLCIERDLFLITDEIYEYFVYEGARHICPATLPGMRADHRRFWIQQDFFHHWLARRLCHGRCALDTGDGTLSRFDVCLLAGASAGRHCRGSGAVAAEFL